MEIAGARWAECEDLAVLVVPVGATEQHGPHLPLGTDTTVAATVAARSGFPTAPALPYGASGEHEGFPGTVSIGTETLAAVIVELGRSACRFARRLVLVNGHGGNVGALRVAVPMLRAEGRDVAWFACGVPGADAHAGRHETAVMLSLAPGDVREDLAAPGNTAPLRELMPAITAGSVRDVSPSGVLGDPTGATDGEGAESVAVMVAALAGAVADWTVDEATGRLT
ncbi:mycofactocin system creatininase family protein [Actinomycetospora sp. NBRC 106375]|uniref:mycofactocin biosynthesis peptidyl-dipeptidase MftE n=1 Tax=Actinomycetospora sp. NBRC 106375 TaxID=3032207 RepID=UPI0024A0E319|nr:mycofactocin biosynthesis peptidyl-dipeptidase MftE [Actinomycetospora sp. NBRC 106375]GLZ45623.1 mycofactocin system creatininase family protein [Actinomycetospora sp. NBRC 106375]